MNDEGVVALLGLVLTTLENNEVRIPYETVERGLPENSGVQVYRDEDSQNLVIRITEFDGESSE